MQKRHAGITDGNLCCDRSYGFDWITGEMLSCDADKIKFETWNDMKDHQKELHPTYQMLRCEMCGLVTSKYKAHEHWKAHMSAMKAGRD